MGGHPTFTEALHHNQHSLPPLTAPTRKQPLAQEVSYELSVLHLVCLH